MGNQFLINENNEEIGELIKLLHINKIDNNKNRALSSLQSKPNNNKNLNLKLNEDINIKRSIDFKSNNKSNSNSIERKATSHSKDKKLSTNNLIYKNQRQNNIHTNIVVRDFSTKSKEKINRNFNSFIL